MARYFIFLLTVFLLFAAGAGDLFAAEAKDGFFGPAYLNLDDFNMSVLGGWISWLKLGLFVFVFLCWVATTDWVSRDAHELKFDSRLWNPIVFGSFMGGFLLLLAIPTFWVGFPLLLIAYIAPLTTYVVKRNASVDNNRRVLTKEHIRYWLSLRLAVVGIKIEAEAPDPHVKGSAVTLAARGADEQQNNVRLLSARQMPGMLDARKTVEDGLVCRASSIMLDYAQDKVTVKLMVDGVWLDREPLSREVGDPALEALKTLCGLKPEDRRNRQKGEFYAELGGKKHEATLTSQGTKSGERALIEFAQKEIQLHSLEEIGMRPKMQEQVKELMGRKNGFLVISAMPSGGLRTSTDVILHSADRLLREFVAIEEEGKRYEDIENVPVTTYSASGEEKPASVLTKLLRVEPEVVVIRDLPDAETVNMMCQEAAKERLMITTMRAKDGAEALARVLAAGADQGKFAKAATAVVYQRLIRKLCDNCKEAYAPTPKTLQQLGLPEGRIEAFYRKPQQTDEKEICEECGGVGYKGRTAIFELLIVGDTVRQVLASAPKLDLLRKAARKDGMRSLQEEGILLVAKGVTSLDELMRVLKQ